MRIIRVFDYLFYRVTGFYRNRWKESEQDRYGICLVAIVQSALIVDILIGFRLLCGDVILVYSPKPAFMLVVIGLFAHSLYRYSNVQKYDMLKQTWDNEEPRTKRRNAVLSALFATISIAIPIVYSTIGHFSKR